MKAFASAACVLLCAATAQAGAVLQVDLLTPPPHPNGAYDPGQVVDFGVSISTNRNSAVQVRWMTLDFRASSPELAFLGPDDYDNGEPGQDGIPEFVFDFSTLVSSAFYGVFPNYRCPDLIRIGLGPAGPGSLLVVPPDSPLHVGAGQLRLPETAGTYTLDALNPTAPSRGTALLLGVTFPSSWTAGAGDITGNSPQLVVVPEPACAALFMTGIAMAFRRPRTNGRLRGSGSARRRVVNGPLLSGEARPTWFEGGNMP